MAFAVLVAAGGAARADAVADLLAPFAAEPSVRDLQRAAARHAEVHPEAVRSWQRRIRAAAAAPSLKLLVGRGGTELQSTVALDGSQRLTVGNGDNWRFEGSASWALDRLVFDHEELRLSREAQRVAARREQLLTEVAQLYYQRRRLQVALLLEPPASPRDAAEAQLDIDELTAILDGLTDGALSHPRRQR
jgi:hypothetical protein